MAKSKRSKPEASLPDEKKKGEKHYAAELERLQEELAHLQTWVKATGQRIVIIFEGRDAAGKGGMIRRITERMNPRVFRVVALPTPSDREKSQVFIQRYVTQLPAAGEILIFDRSWYNRAGVERVMGFTPEEKVQRFLELVPALRGDPDRGRHHAPQVLPRRERGRAGEALPPADRRPAAAVEAESHGSRIVPALVGLLQGL